MPINRIAPKKSKIEHNEGPQREQNEGPQTKERKCIWITLKLKYTKQFPTRPQSVWTTLIISSWTGKH